ncbi:rhamnan synthesis F family protein [Actinotalea fermentans]|uniref:Rhamnan synthesis protein F n=1 Tax=Actinotalea fermentans TaxID=43671 RepID=A0A511Z2G1_9CELL|nr:rhamnan synthesis F family protein [Actinotalea fermentans]KGM16660.1 hypothetical protein N867_17595 [Actinotalea fermentans ATCC 43279 = JCM 9966 = DSM 3133]GEN81635.1 hypothetical protein AFE02nite_33690 [Actinotalea fermentans]
MVEERVGGEFAAAVAGGKAAVIAHWSRSPQVTLSVRALVGQLSAAGYAVLLSSSSPAGPLVWGDLDLSRVAVLRKPNVGYDFGSWAVALDRYPDLAAADTLVLTNDSMVGPFASIAPQLDLLASSTTDVWGMTETAQFTRHIQSYFLGFRRGVLRRPALAAFWRDVRHYDDKQLVIHRGELALATLLHREGIPLGAAFPAGSVVGLADNPTIIGWRRLLEAGFPFVKREVVRSPHLAPDGDRVAEVVRDLYDVDVADWMEHDEAHGEGGEHG